MVLSSFLLPVISAPFFILKDAATYHLPGNFEGQITIRLGRLLLTPPEPFDAEKSPPIPNYTQRRFWAARGDPDDSAESFPPGTSPPLTERKALAFYLHPTTWYTGASWNAPAQHPATDYLSDDAIIPQQASAFNLAAKVWAPRYRQMSAGGYMQDGGIGHEDSRLALDVAYADVRAAFKVFLEAADGRPVLIGGHSQGALLGRRILREFFCEKGCPHRHQLVAAYLLGWSVFPSETGGVPPCDSPTQVGCVVSFRTFAEGGSPEAFLHTPPPPPQPLSPSTLSRPPSGSSRELPICVNPLSWRSGGGSGAEATAYVDRVHNLGAVDLLHPWTMWRYLVGSNHSTPASRVVPPVPTKNVAGARCADGALFTERASMFGYGWWVFPSWTFASMPGRNLHAYDFNLYFVNIRENAAARVAAFLQMS